MSTSERLCREVAGRCSFNVANTASLILTVVLFRDRSDLEKYPTHAGYYPVVLTSTRGCTENKALCAVYETAYVVRNDIHILHPVQPV